MSWLDEIHTSLYKCQADNTGQVKTMREILFSQFGVPHDWFYRGSSGWVTGRSTDLTIINKMRALDREAPDYKRKKVELKAKLQAYTPACHLKTKKKGEVQEIKRTGLMQLDFDYEQIKQYDIDELKQWVFSLPFIGFCGLSCSGDGFYALGLIAEPEKLAEYAEQCFKVFQSNGIDVDTSKGKKVENLRYLSYDSNMLVKEDPEPLRIKRFIPKPTPVYRHHIVHRSDSDGLTKWAVGEINRAQVGQRWPTVQKAAYTLGGQAGDIDALIDAIRNNNAFAGEEEKYIKCARDCYKEGTLKPLIENDFNTPYVANR